VSIKILICDPSSKNRDDIKSLLDEQYEVIEVPNGKEAQKQLYSEKFYALIIDLETQNHSTIEVLRYSRIAHPSVRIILSCQSPKQLKDAELDANICPRLGIASVIFRPYRKEQIVKAVNGNFAFELQKIVQNAALQQKKSQAEPSTEKAQEKEVSLRDDLFTHIEITNFYSGNASIFDVYLKMGAHRYIKILNKGDFLPLERLKHYHTQKGITHLYFLTKDRALYIHYLNECLERLNQVRAMPEKKVKIIKTLTEKYIEEIFVEGLQPQLVEEGEKICGHIHSIIKKEAELYKLLRKMQELSYSAQTHAFMVVFFSSVICQKMTWETKSTIQKMALGGMLHDIGKLSLSPMSRELPPWDLNSKQVEEYKKHPELGISLIERFSFIGPEIKQIIFQHHEKIDGTGFPRGLTGMKIYPLAQIVGFADICSNIMLEKKLTPPQALQYFLNNQKLRQQYNQTIVTSFVRCLSNPEEIKLS